MLACSKEIISYYIVKGLQDRFNDNWWNSVIKQIPSHPAFNHRIIYGQLNQQIEECIGQYVLDHHIPYRHSTMDRLCQYTVQLIDDGNRNDQDWQNIDAWLGTQLKCDSNFLKTVEIRKPDAGYWWLIVIMIDDQGHKCGDLHYQLMMLGKYCEMVWHDCQNKTQSMFITQQAAQQIAKLTTVKRKVIA